jgi:hypothetical protein
VSYAGASTIVDDQVGATVAVRTSALLGRPVEASFGVQ